MPALAAKPYWTRRLAVRALRRPPLGRRRWPVLVVGMLLIAGWQHQFFAHREALDTRYTVREMMGMNHEWRFLYFLYYTGLYPVVSMEGHVRMMGEPGYKRFSPEAARRVIAERGETLWMEWDYTIRAGDLGRTFLYLPYAVWSGSARDPRLAPTHAVVFTLALLALFGAFWWVRDPVLGAAAVALLGSNPFQLQVVHAQENVFGWTLTTAILTLALTVPIFWRRPGRFAWGLAALTGVLLATVRQVRPEPLTMLASAGATCLLFAPASWRRRFALTATLAAAFVVAGLAWRAYFDHKFDEARAVVAAAGGNVYSGPRDLHHSFWHPLWCGLGDFDDKYGYEWSDPAARRYATPIVRERYAARGLPPPDDRVLQWEPAYNEVLKAKVLHDIRTDPAWYLGILVRRVGRVVMWTTPVRLSFGSRWLDLPWNGPATLVLVGVLAWLRSWRLVELAVFPLATSITAMLVFSGTVRGQTYTGWFHVVGAAIVLAGVVSVLAEWWRLRSRPG